MSSTRGPPNRQPEYLPGRSLIRIPSKAIAGLFGLSADLVDLSRPHCQTVGPIDDEVAIVLNGQAGARIPLSAR